MHGKKAVSKDDYMSLVNERNNLSKKLCESKEKTNELVKLTHAYNETKDATQSKHENSWKKF